MPANKPYPEKIGKYRVLRPLGKGGFGQVYLAFDDDLKRQVAIKVPNPDRIQSPKDLQNYFAEAQILAKLDHPHIVPVYDLGRTDDGLCYVVSRFIEGSDLSKRIRSQRPSLKESVEIVAVAAEALHYAHGQGLVHRDCKPENILIEVTDKIEVTGKVWLADFGLALKDEDYGKGSKHAGTPAYMSPEQARGEGHRVDGRSDIFSLGDVLYELLTGGRPFKADSQRETLELIKTTEPRPLRQINDTIPRELERICTKALAKRVVDRYNTAKDMAEDLHAFLATSAGTAMSAVTPSPVSTPSPAAITPPAGSTRENTPPQTTAVQTGSGNTPLPRVVPKGLRSFDDHDADFFLELLPGPRDRDGLPESIRFWKRKIEQFDADRTFSIGLIYGPSGCGKSSLMKAGLLPRLARNILHVYIEATPEETETRLLKGLRKACPGLPADAGLVDSLASLRRGYVLPEGQKVLLVLDQFEQWLHAHPGAAETELVAALRQADGEHVQAMVMVRDDFWLATDRFMSELELRLVKGENMALIDLFETDHAQKVLKAFGRAYGKLAEDPSAVTSDQNQFIEQAVAAMADAGRVISVRLALFADMMKGKSWNPASLEAVGGTDGIGITFLEDNFSTSLADQEHKLHQKAAQAVLNALLPEIGSDIKGQMRSRQELLSTSGYANQPRNFDALLRILDRELRLISPTDPEGLTGDEPGPTGKLQGAQYYQLTHDYLVPALREWLTRKQRETRRGRAGLKLAERSALWNSKPENRHLPSLWEWANIRALTSKGSWTAPQHRLMARAGRVHGVRVALAAAGVGLVTFAGMQIQAQTLEQQKRTQAQGLTQSLHVAQIDQVPEIVQSLEPFRRWANDGLRTNYANSEEKSHQKLNAALALLPSVADANADPALSDFVYSRLLEASPEQVPVILKFLAPFHNRYQARLWSVLETPEQTKDPRRLQAAAALAAYEPLSEKKWSAVAGPVASDLVSVNPVFIGSWLDALRPVRSVLNRHLLKIFQDSARAETERSLATNILTDYAADDAAVLTDALMTAAPKAYSTLFPVVQKLENQTAPVLKAAIGGKMSAIAVDGLTPAQVKNVYKERQARAAIALFRMGLTSELLASLIHGQDQVLLHGQDQVLRNLIVNWLEPLGADPSRVATLFQSINPLSQPPKAAPPETVSAFLFHPETSQRRALILSLGTFGKTAWPAAELETLTSKLLELYRTDPDAGIHSAAAWTLKQFGKGQTLKEIDGELARQKPRLGHRWFVNGQAQTFTRVEAVPGQVNQQFGREMGTIDKPFAIGTLEVSTAEFDRFINARKEPKYSKIVPMEMPIPNVLSVENGIMVQGPANVPPRDRASEPVFADFYSIVAYCNWLNAQEGIPEDQWCYQPNSEGVYAEGMTMVADVSTKTGYRLPNIAEWTYALQGISFDVPLIELSDEYYESKGRKGLLPCGSFFPNDLGMSDLFGNQEEVMINTVNDQEPNLHDTIELKASLLRVPGPIAAIGFPLATGTLYRGGFRLARTCP